jgi:hypothetical protein
LESKPAHNRAMHGIQIAGVAAHLNALAQTNGWPMRCDSELAFEQSELSQLCELWFAKAGEGVPARSALDMRALKPFASHVTILERVGAHPARRYRFRLFGSTLALLFGEHTGRFLDEMVSPALLPNWLAFYDAVLAHRTPFRFINYYRIPSADYLKGEILAAPMADDTGEARLVLAATYVGLEDGAPPPFG